MSGATPPTTFDHLILRYSDFDNLYLLLCIVEDGMVTESWIEPDDREERKVSSAIRYLKTGMDDKQYKQHLEKNNYFYEDQSL